MEIEQSIEDPHSKEVVPKDKVISGNKVTEITKGLQATKNILEPSQRLIVSGRDNTCDHDRMFDTLHKSSLNAQSNPNKANEI